MTITASKTWPSYNARRYSRPWAAHITSFTGGPELDFIPRAYNGSDAGGELVITAEPGEIIKYGHKDSRGNGTINTFARVEPDGTLTDIDTPAKAREQWNAWKESK